MTKGRDIAAESLTEIFDLIRTRRQSGLLSVEHSRGTRIEEGEIYFQEGQPVYARIGQLVGQVALSFLLTWRQVHFTFLTGVPRPLANLPVSKNTGNVPQISSSLPSTPPAGEPEAGFSPPSNPTSRNPDQIPSIGSSPTLARETLIPQKSSNQPDVLSLPLTRRQRTIYFLIDGRRSISDLTRCTGKTILEVDRILTELHEQGLIMPPS